jgi:hypothetical protein
MWISAATFMPWRTIVHVIAPALVLLGIVAPFLRFHEYALLLPESLALMGGAVGLGTLIGMVACLRPLTLGPLLMAVVLVVYAFYRPEVTDKAWMTVRAVNDVTGDLGVAVSLVLVPTLLAVFFLCWLLRRNLSALVSVTFGTMVAATLVLPAETGGEVRIAGGLPVELQDLPPLIHIILDEHVGLAALPADIDGSAEAGQAMRRTFEDFALYSRAYSRYAETQLSLAALMTPDREDIESLLAGRHGQYELLANAWLGRLSEAGYAIQVYQTDFLDLCSRAATVDACYIYPMFSPNPVQRSSLSTTARWRVLFDDLWAGRTAPLPGPFAATEALERLRTDLSTGRRGVAYIVHLLLPHQGYVYRRDCSTAEPEDWESGGGLDGLSTTRRRAVYAAYFDQVICTHSRIARLFDDLKALGIYDQATIIVHGDHGSRLGERHYKAEFPADLSERDLLDHFSTLLAIKAPGIAPGVREEPVALQRFFAETFFGRQEAGDPMGDVFVRDMTRGGFATRDLLWEGRVAGRRPESEGSIARRSHGSANIAR